MKSILFRQLSIGAAAAYALTGVAGSAAAVEDLGKKACVVEARRLCPAEMRTFSRKKVEACMIAKIDRTSPTCHAAMLRIKAERQAAARN